MILCCSTPMIPANSLTAQAELLRDWGYDAIAVFQPREEWNPKVHDELRSLESRTGVRPVEFVLTGDIYGNAMSENPELRAQCRDMYREAAEVCAELGLVTEIEFEYGAQDPMPLFDPYQQLTAAQDEEFTAFYTELLDRVAGSDAAILLEPLNRYESRYLNSVADNLDVVKRVAHPNAGLLPDTFHMSIEEADIPAALRAAGDQVRHVHLGDSNRLLPGHGALDWADIFLALRDIDYRGALNLECSTTGDPAITLPRTAAELRELIGA
ncbi:MAG: sugar phosphate isomerase/epimerase [Candidatus Microbacterium colombiense]|nr:MAG: sugar phosphate isomerase/epimerase [Microbacterium sp.]